MTITATRTYLGDLPVLTDAIQDRVGDASLLDAWTTERVINAAVVTDEPVQSAPETGGIIASLKRAGLSALLATQLSAASALGVTGGAYNPPGLYRHCLLVTAPRRASSSNDGWCLLPEEGGFWSGVGSSTDDFPNLYRDHSVALAEEDSRGSRLFQNILSLLGAEPVEDGFSHPAEMVMEDALEEDRALASRWIEQVYENMRDRSPSIASGIIRCLGRLPEHLTRPWSEGITLDALSHPDPEMREAAIRTYERWAGDDALDTLRDQLQKETEPGLRQYLALVIDDLAAEAA